MTNRRKFLFGAASAALAAPAIVPLSSLMKLWVPKPALIPYVGPSQLLLDQLAQIDEIKHRIAEQWFMGYHSWRRVYFDEDRQEVVSEQVFPERPFVTVPNSGKLIMPENAPLGTMITVRS